MIIPPNMLNFVAGLNPIRVVEAVPHFIKSVQRSVQAISPPEQSKDDEIQEHRLKKPRINPLSRFKNKRPFRSWNKDRGQNLDVEI
jgi:hypothetical protein